MMVEYVVAVVPPGFAAVLIGFPPLVLPVVAVATFVDTLVFMFGLDYAAARYQ